MKVKQFEFNMLPVNTYVVWDKLTREAVVIDAGCYTTEECEVLRTFIEEEDLVVKYLLNTHLHFDHIFGNGFMYKQYGLKTCAHRGDEEWLMDAPNRTRMFGMEFPGEPVPVGTYLEDGDELTLGYHTIKCIHVPGHSMGSLAFYISDARTLFSGDILFRGSIGRSDLPGGNIRVLIDGIRDKLLTLPDATLVYPGHGEATTIGCEKMYNFYMTL
ncbi:MAG: MBL fold metallo-hydrolase [Bacteroidaceae bacterium]|nr:MBL fold metallo-hydrolase [Bacteroidaceae bacterium]